jgi:diguanylate cyclase (GGDEF)-like protein
MRASVYTKFLLYSVPLFVILSASGLFLFAEYATRNSLDELTARIGSHAGRVAGLISRTQIEAGRGGAPDLISTLLSDRAVQCAEIRLSSGGAAVIAAPRGVGCLGQESAHKLELPLVEPRGATLVVRFTTAEVDEERRARREFTFLVIAFGFVLAIATTALGFRQAVGRPLASLLSAIRQTSATGQYCLVPEGGRDEFGVVAKAFNAMQRQLQEKSEHLSVALGQLQTQNERFNVALANMPHGLCMFDPHKRLVVCNARYTEMYGLAEHLTCPGTPLLDILQFRGGAGNAPVHLDTYTKQHEELARRTDTTAFNCELQDGRTIRISHRPMSDGGYVAAHEDITEIVRVEAQISYMAHHDALTDLPNRVLFKKKLEEALTRGHRDSRLAVLYLDLDQFKAVNDTLGHPTGDALLQAVAERLRGCIRDADTVARFGGDEFAIVQVGTGQPYHTTELAQRIIEKLSAPYDLDGHHVVIGASVGIALAPHDGIDPDHLLKAADMALYRAKADRRGTFRYFEPDMDAKMQARRVLELDLRKALLNDEFEVHYQPLINIAEDRVSCFEALLRWNHPLRGQLLPDDFISLAEEIGLIRQIGVWVLRQAAMDATEWPDDVSLAVNLSSAQFKDLGLVQDVVAALEASGLPATRLELEITETMMLHDTRNTLAILHKLRELGVRISMDDFGTGYSSLSYLRKFPFDKIKIDRSFIGDLPGGSDAVAIIKAISGLGISLGMTTTAEGVENRAQLDKLRLEGCTEVQGYLFSPARPASQLANLLSCAPGSIEGEHMRLQHAV